MHNTKKTEVTNYRFYKEHETCWYIDLPNYDGDREDLKMVAGADVMLDELSEGKTEVVLTVAENRFQDSEVLSLINETNFWGADYTVADRKIWLCNVTRLVFGILNIYTLEC